jgi:hypothetical protein
VLQCKVHKTSLSVITSSSYEAGPFVRAFLGVAVAHLLGLGFRNPLETSMFPLVNIARRTEQGLCDGLIIRSDSPIECLFVT